MASHSKMLIEILTIEFLTVGMVLSSRSAVGSWEGVFLFSMVLTVSQNIFELVLQATHFCLKKLF